MTKNLYSVLHHSAEGERDAATSLDHSPRNLVRFAGCNSVLPVVAGLSGHHEHVAGFENDIPCVEPSDTSHRHDARRSKTDGENGVIEAGAAVDVKGNSLTGGILIDDQLIERGVYQSLVVETVQEFQSPVGKRTDSGIGGESLAAVVVAVSVLLDSTFEIILPGRMVDHFHQFGLGVGSDVVPEMSKPRNGEFIRGNFEKHGASISLGRSYRRSESRSYA
jgi:hypothetical protein